MATPAVSAAAAARMAEAIKASGAIVRLSPDEFAKILRRSTDPLVVCAPGGFWHGRFRYLTAYKGLIFFAQTDDELELPKDAEIVVAGKIWIP